MLSNPPWETKIGQLQQVTRTIKRNSDALLDNRGAVIVRCYPYRSNTYMHLVYNLIYSTLASNAQFGTDQTPDEIRPILLNYGTDSNNNSAKQTNSNPPAAMTTSHLGAASFVNGVFHYADGQLVPQQHQWTDCVLIRVHFRSHESALFFMQAFNRSVFRVFDRRQVRAPFCHSDLTRPERVLRNYLQKLCDEKNNAANKPQQPYYQSRYSTVSARYYHNGFHLYKELPNGRVELVPWEPFSLGQYLHVMVASLRKYAALYKQKQCFVIIQNIAEHSDSAEEDAEQITSIVNSIVSTDTYRKRCIQIKQKIDLLKNIATDVNSATSVKAPPNLQTNAYLPQRIERLSRRGVGSSASRSTVAMTRVTEQRAGTTGQQQQTARQMQQQQTTAVEADEVDEKQREENAKANESPSRPALVRVQFRAREAAIAFCQLFRERQQFKRQNQQQQNPCQPQFAHRDLTPPELALGYALRQHYRLTGGACDSMEKTI